MIASQRNHKELIQYLVEDRHVKTLIVHSQLNCTALHFALIANHFEVVDYLLKHNENNSINKVRKKKIDIYLYANK